MSTTNTKDTIASGFMSYEDYLKDSEYMKKAQENAKNTLDKSINAANNAYAQSLATYGTNAEALARMGLTGSGYSDYLTGQAYAQQRADINAANAQYNKTMSAAGYQDYLNYKTEADNYKNNYINLYNDVLTGKYGASDIESLAAQYGISTDSTDYANLGTAADTYETNRQSQLYASLLGDLYDNGYSSDEIKTIAEAYGLTDTNYLGKLTDTATSIADKAYLEDAKEKVYDGMFEGLSYADAKESLDEILEDTKLTDLHTDVQKYFDKSYGSYTKGLSLDKTSSNGGLSVSDISPSTLNKSADVITIKNTKTNEQYKVIKGASAGKKISSALGTGKENELAVYDGKCYIYVNGEWRSIKSTGNFNEPGYHTDYYDLLRFIKNNKE